MWELLPLGTDHTLLHIAGSSIEMSIEIKVHVHVHTGQQYMQSITTFKNIHTSNTTLLIIIIIIGITMHVGKTIGRTRS